LGANQDRDSFERGLIEALGSKRWPVPHRSRFSGSPAGPDPRRRPSFPDAYLRMFRQTVMSRAFVKSMKKAPTMGTTRKARGARPYLSTRTSCWPWHGGRPQHEAAEAAAHDGRLVVAAMSLKTGPMQRTAINRT